MSRTMRALALLATLALLAVAPARACGLRVEVLYTTSAYDAPPAAVPVLVRLHEKTTGAAVRTRLPQRAGGHWLRLSCTARVADAGWQLVVDGPDSLGPLTLYPPGAAPSPLSARHDPDAPRRVRGWTLALPHGWPSGSVAYVHAAGTSAEPVSLRVVPAAVLAREAQVLAWRAQAAAAVLAVLALVMLVTHLRHRDLLYLSYAGYCVCVASYLVVVAGADGSALAPFSSHGAAGRWTLATLAFALQLVFTRRVLELDRLVPAGAHIVRVLFALQLVLLAALLLGRAQVHEWYPSAANTVLLIGAPLLIGAAMFAWHRGAAYAGYYLVGWTPLVAVAALMGADRLGAVDAPWARALLAPAAVMEALVLAFALTRQVAHRRRLGRRLRSSNERDALTGAPNAIALARLLDGWRDLGALGARSYAVILIELDGFDAFSARHGLPTADAVLCQMHARCRLALDADDALARIGGARFAVVHEGDRVDAERLARTLVDAISLRPFDLDGVSYSLNACAGLALAAGDEPVGRLMQRARQALRASQGRPAGTASAAVASDASPPPWAGPLHVHVPYGETPRAFTADA